jgi:aspartate/tyrosine/aromatic aminotransferase
MTFFTQVPKAPLDPILGLTTLFLRDSRQQKINLGAGVYKTEDGKTPILSCVKQAERFLLEQEESKIYSPIEGDSLYLEKTARFVLGESLYDKHFSSLGLMQTVGGAGALRLGGDFLQKEVACTKCYLSNPTWPNHPALFTQSGLSVSSYPYYDFQKKEVDFEGMLAFLSEIPAKSVVLLHAGCHNPSGADLTRTQWRSLADLLLAKQLIPFLDAAYLGFDVSFEEDAFPIRLFASLGMEFLTAVSFSKNFSLYGERVGLLMVFSHETSAANILSQLRVLARRTYSNPPLHGAKIVAKILQEPSLTELWKSELALMKDRIDTLRNLFVSRLSLETMQTDYSYLSKARGLFSFCNLSKQQVDRLQEEYAIYMPSDGRINIAGLSTLNVDYVVNALIAVGG